MQHQPQMQMRLIKQNLLQVTRKKSLKVIVLNIYFIKFYANSTKVHKVKYLTIDFIYYYFVNKLFQLTGRQPVVHMIEGVLEKVTDKWDKQDDRMNERMDTLITLQRQCLDMEREQLAFQRELAGLKAKKKGWFGIKCYGCPDINWHSMSLLF